VAVDENTNSGKIINGRIYILSLAESDDWIHAGVYPALDAGQG